MWDLPGPGIEPMPLALAGGFLTIGNSIYQKKLEVYSQDDKAHVQQQRPNTAKNK